MITKKQLKIFRVFAKNPFMDFTRKEIKKESGCNSNNALALAVNLLKKENVLIEQKVGNSGILRLNLNNEMSFYYIALCNYERTGCSARQAIDALREQINEETPFFSAVIFGSYAAGEQKKGSDLDIAVFIESSENKKRIEACVNSARIRILADADVHVISRAEMLEMLAEKDENLGKQIAKKHLTAYNHRIFYEIIKEGFRHGFRIQDLPFEGRE